MIAMLLGFAISSCEDDDVVVGEDDDEEIVGGGSGEMISTTFTVGISAPNVSGDLDVATRAGGDNANIEYANLENGGRFQNLIVVLAGDTTITVTIPGKYSWSQPTTKKENRKKIYGISFSEWPGTVGVKEHTVIFSDLKVNKDSVGKQKFYAYAFANVCKDHFTAIKGDSASKITTIMEDWDNLKNYCTDAEMSVDNAYDIKFTLGEETYKIGGNAVESMGMPLNNKDEATLVKGNTQFNVTMKRVCARLQVTFRNFTGKTGYSGESASGNNVYVDKFEIPNFLATSTKYASWNSAPATSTTPFKFSELVNNFKDADDSDFDKDHVKVENGEPKTVSMYVFETKKASGNYTYDLKVDRGKSLGQQVNELQNDNVYVMWSDNLDEGTKYANSENRCLGANDKNILLVPMSNPADVPYGTGDYGNRVFWHHNGGKFQSCKVDLKTDKCVLTGKYIPYSIGANTDYSTTLGSAHSFSPRSSQFDGFQRFALKIVTNYLMISKNSLQSRIIIDFENSRACYPWVFFAKYIIKNEAVNFNKGEKGTISKIDRNHSYELDFSVMPNYNTKQELVVSCVRKQNEITWSEVEK